MTNIQTPWLLRRVNQRFRDAMRAALDAAGFEDLPQPAFWALGAVHDHQTEASDLVSEMGVTKQAVSRLVDSLVTLGYLEREVNEEDRRRTRLVLTARGRRAAKTISSAVEAEEKRMAAEVGVDELGALRAALLVLAELPRR